MGSLAPAGLDAAADTSPALDESTALRALTAHSILPALDQTASTAEKLENKVRLFCENPDAQTWAGAQAAWKEAYFAWQRTAPFLFGPGGKIDRQIGRWAVNPVVLDAAVDRPDLAHLLKNSEQRGYAALEFLLFTPKTAKAAATPGRCAHLRDVAEEIARLTRQMQLDWANGFAAKFAAAGDGQPFLLPADALSLMFTQTLNVLEDLLRDRIGTPSGFFEAELAKPEELAAWRSQSTQAGFSATVAGIRRAMNAGDDSLVRLLATKNGLVEKKNPALAQKIVRQLDQLDRTIADLGGPDLRLEVELRKNPAAVKKLYRQFQKLQEQLIEAALVLELDVYARPKK